MKNLLLLFLIPLWGSFIPYPLNSGECYSRDYVEISIVNYGQQQYNTITMKRKNDRIKAKYFAAKDYNGNSVYQRFQQWKKSHPQVILLSSGTYMDRYKTPQGLTIDNGVVVNQGIMLYKMDALVIVYATGGVVVSNLKAGNLKVSGINTPLNLRENPNDLDTFIQWAEANEATVFQTHLLVHENRNMVSGHNSDIDPRERRFLAVGKDENGEIFHIIIHNPSHSTLYEGTQRVLNFVNDFKDIEVVFMINLDTGAQDVFELYNSNCTTNQTIKGPLPPSQAVNLLAYYFE